MNTTKFSRFTLSLMLGASAALAAGNIYTAPSFFDENGAYFGPDNDQTNYNGAYYTGDYTSPFKTYLGKTDAEIQEKMDALWNHYFKGDNNSKVYYDNGNEAYIKDINNNDVRSEGMSYGMMIAVQTNHKEEFGKLW
ncbi:MAG: glycoside hydrolase, partial [Fibrobacteraceae bacterium]|nr:glycoside hydrolase [Fibrobacteraceae bacterium]